MPVMAAAMTATPRPHINGFLCGRLNNPLMHGFGVAAANRHPKHATHQCASYGPLLRLLLRFPRVKPISQPARHEQAPRGHTSMASYGPLKQSLGMLHPAANRHPKATHQWLLMGRLNNPLACFILQPTGTPRPHINGFLWVSKPAVCQPLDP